MAVETVKIKQLTIGDKSYEIDARHLLDQNGAEKSYEDILALIESKAHIVMLAELPEANAESYATYKDAIVLVPASTTGNVKDEYIILRNGSEGAYTYAWEKIGDTAIDLSNYMQKGVEYSNAALEAGAHTHTVSGTVTVPTVQKTESKLSVSATKSKLVVSEVIPAVAIDAGSRPTKTVFGTDTTASKATAGTAINYGTADVGTAVSVPNVTGNDASNAVTLTDVSTDTAVATFAQGAKASFTQGEKASFTQGAKASWSAAVDANGVLSFSWAANGDDSFTANGDDSFTANGDDTFTTKYYKTSDASKVTLGDALSINPAVAAAAGQTITPYTFADVAVPVVSSNNEIEVAKAGTAANVATGGVSIEGTGAELMTGASVAAGATGDVDFVASVTVGSESVNLADGATASAGAHTHNIKASTT